MASDDPDVAERIRLRDGYEARSWFYALGLLLVIAGLVAVAVRADPTEARRERFRDLGVAGVAVGVLTWIGYASEPNLISDDGGETAIWLPTVALLVAAGLGSLGSRRPARIPAVALLAVGLAALVAISAPVIGLFSIIAAACLN